MDNKEFLFYIDFRRNLLRPFWTFIGAIRTNSVEFSKEPVETMDYNNNFKMLIPGSGVEIVNISLEGILENYQEQFFRLFQAHKNTENLLIRLTSGDKGLEITGNFIISAINSDSEHNVENTFSMNLVNNGEVKVNKNA